MSDLILIRTTSKDKDFRALVEQLDAYLSIQDGDEHAFYDQYNKLDRIKHTLVAYLDDRPIGCGAIKAFDKNSMEVKRMFVLPEARGKGIATKILKELENWTLQLNYSKCVLETGIRQPEAVALYSKNGYVRIPNYGQYAGVANSLCFEKILASKSS